MNVHNVEPKPNNIIDTADISAFLFDFLNHSKRFFTGTTYPQPSANPHNTPIPMYNATMLWICIAIPLRQRPKNRRIVEIIDAAFMFFSTNGPKNAAPIPKKNMFRQNANCIAFIGELNTSAKCGENMLNAYVHPMHNVNNAQGMTDFDILYNVFMLLYVYSSYKEKGNQF